MSLEKYRQTRLQCPIAIGTLHHQQKRDFEVEARLYIDVCSDGETRFGVVGADGGNAICLLEPIFVLGRQLVRLATD
ncbi:hypothetical protein [Burkholderia cepacia]|uniref:hypothetical protein n=1 Tax=Burkholderia cepacia TaxID=292 RepID=UPI002FE05FA7